MASDAQPLVGSAHLNTVTTGASARTIAAVHGMSVGQLKALNGRQDSALQPGSVLRVDDRHLVPAELNAFMRW